MTEFSDKQKDGYSRATVLCSRAEKSPASIQQKLQQWGLDDSETDSVMQRLFQEKYLDEERFARSYVRDKFRFNQWGRVKIAYHLKAERISSAVIQSALEEINDDDYGDTIRKLIQEKIRKTKAANSYDLRAKVFRFAQSRGFESDLIFSIFDQLVND